MQKKNVNSFNKNDDSPGMRMSQGYLNFFISAKSCYVYEISAESRFNSPISEISHVLLKNFLGYFFEKKLYQLFRLQEIFVVTFKNRPDES